MIILPKGAFIVLQDEAQEKKNKIIVSVNKTKPKKPNTGKIIFTSEELNKYQFYRVVFRESFAEEININGKPYLFFRDFNSSIYYVSDEKRTN